MAFYELEDNMELAEDFLKYLIRYALENCADDLAFLAKMYDGELLERLRFVVENDFVRLDYTEGIEILEKSGEKFEFRSAGASTCRASTNVIWSSATSRSRLS